MGAALQADADVDTSKTKKKSFHGFVQVAIRADVLKHTSTTKYRTQNCQLKKLRRRRRRRRKILVSTEYSDTVRMGNSIQSIQK